MMKGLIIGIFSLAIIGCGSSSDSAVSVANTPVNEPVKDEIIFQENFDDIPDWTCAKRKAPINWERIRSGEEQWYPENGHPDRRNTMEILAENKDKARGKIGKSLVINRESIDLGKNYWTSDGILTKSLKTGVKEIYVEFYIHFPKGFTHVGSGNSKIFRISSNDSVKKGKEHEYYLGFKSGHNGPMVIQVYGVGQYGARNFLAFRGDPYYQDGNSLYYLTHKEMGPLPRQINRGDMSLNYAADRIGMGKDGTTPKLPDLLNGGYLSTEQYKIYNHEQVYGKLGSWTKLGYYVKMNSAPGKKDGVMIQWLNDVRIFSNHEISWHRYRPDGDMPTWNSISFGGNNYFPRLKDLDRFEDSYAIDDIVIRTTIPANLR